MITQGDNVVICPGARYGGKTFTSGLQVPAYMFNRIVRVTILDQSGDAYIEEIHSWIPLEHLREIPQRAPATGGPFKTHGMSNSRLYRIYYAMRQRCYNPKAINYRNYGEKGIAVCNDWMQGFEPFCKWAISAGYTDDLEIDRIDPGKGYSPENCRWITKKENVGRANHGRKAKEESHV